MERLDLSTLRMGWGYAGGKGMRQTDQADPAHDRTRLLAEPVSRGARVCSDAKTVGYPVHHADPDHALGSCLMPLRFAIVDEALSAAPEVVSTQRDLLFLAAEFNLIRREFDAWRDRAEQEAPATCAYIQALDRHLARLLEALMLRELGDGENLWRAVDLRPDGLSFRNDRVLPRGSLLDLRFLLPGAGIGIRSLGRVVRCDQPTRDGRHLIGVRFLDLGEADRELLCHYLGLPEV